jgi:hypothetical protein
MICPHCQIACHESAVSLPGFQHAKVVVEGTELAPAITWFVYHMRCPQCHKLIVFLEGTLLQPKRIIYPTSPPPRPVPLEVNDPFKADFIEACTVFPHSPKASAAISRRCLQMVLRDVAKVKPSDLSHEIDAILPTLPSALAESVDAIRAIGNFAAHPIKSTNTGEIIPVEPGEAEWLLDVLEAVFDFYFVQPAILKKKREQLNAKLAEANKPPMK